MTLLDPGEAPKRMIRFGPKFDPTGLKPEITIVIPIIGMLSEQFHKEVILSSGTDREHSSKSLHYVGLAIDFYWDHFNGYDEDGAEHQLGRLLASALGPRYDVVIHGTHIHIEYQPKVAN